LPQANERGAANEWCRKLDGAKSKRCEESEVHDGGGMIGNKNVYQAPSGFKDSVLKS
jgi:hypothetical protein